MSDTLEWISIREAGRRLGVSDTAVHKAIRSERIDAPSGEPKRLPWPLVREQWGANTNEAHRTHAGSKYSGRDAPEFQPLREQMLQARQDKPIRAQDDEEVQPPPQQQQSAATAGPSLAQSRAVHEAYKARLAKIEYETAIGKLIDADAVKARAFAAARKARDTLQTMPDRLAPILASTTDVREVHRLLLEDIDRLCEQLSAAAANA